MSKFKTIEPKPGVIILPIKVPEDASTFVTDWKFLIIDFFTPTQKMIPIPEGNWIPLGISTELAEEQYAQLVKSNGNSKRYLHYPVKTVNTYFETAKESFASFMQANGMYEVNPYGEEPKDIPDLGAFTQSIRHRWRLWKESEANTGKYLILKLVE